MKLKRLTGERPSTVLAWHRVAEGNCVAERRGGEQPKANLSSQSSQTRQLNPIRPFGMASLRVKGEALALSLPEAITKHDHTIAKDSDGVWDEKAGKAEQLSVEILLGATESGEEVRALIVALKRVTTVEPRDAGKWMREKTERRRTTGVSGGNASTSRRRPAATRTVGVGGTYGLDRAHVDAAHDG